MNIQITSDNIQVSPSMKALAEQKLTRLQNQIHENTPEDLAEVRVVLNKGEADGTFEVKVDFAVGGMKFFGKATEYNLESALVDALDDTIRQFRKEREKKNDEDWKTQRELKVFDEDAE